MRDVTKSIVFQLGFQMGLKTSGKVLGVYSMLCLQWEKKRASQTAVTSCAGARVEWAELHSSLRDSRIPPCVKWPRERAKNMLFDLHMLCFMCLLIWHSRTKGNRALWGLSRRCCCSSGCFHSQSESSLVRCASFLKLLWCFCACFERNWVNDLKKFVARFVLFKARACDQICVVFKEM